ARGTAMSILQTVHAVGDHLRHSADIAADDGAAIHEGLLSYKRRVLPPDRAHDHPVDVSHQPGHLFWLVLADQGDVVARVLEQPREQALELAILKIEVGPMHLQRHSLGVVGPLRSVSIAGCDRAGAAAGWRCLIL